MLMATSFFVWGQIPTGYYDSADGLTGYTLKSELHNIIDNHTDRGYSTLWDLYETSDVRDDGKVWDMYSDCNFEFVTDQDPGSGGNTECDKFNREHSMPKSWFNDASPMQSDPFHVIPTDKKVNSIRGNYAYGEVNSATYTSLNGSKLGANTVAGYTGTVFEPADEYKGDLARGYFYMATRYEDVISGWENHNANGDAMLDGSADQVFETWALEMLLSWHESDPVSQKEIDRNEAIYDFQGNRNPFIDHPEWVLCIWNNECGSSSSPSFTVSESLTDFGDVDFGESSAIQSYAVSGTGLTSDIAINASTHFEISLTDNTADFSKSLTITPTAGTVNTTNVYVRFTPESDANGVLSGTITHNTDGAANQVIEVTGSESENSTAEPVIAFNGNAAVIAPTDNYTITINSNQTVQEELPFNLSIASTLNLDYGENGFATSPALNQNTELITLLIQPNNTSTALTLSFGADVHAEVTKKILFQLQDGSGYDVGTNNTFELTINPGEGTTVVTGIPDFSKEKSLFYPNPASKEVVFDTEYAQVTIYNIRGGVEQVGYDTQRMSILDLDEGIYYIKFQQKSVAETKKLIVTH